MTDPKLRAWWSHRQGLDGRLDGLTASQVLSESGWARSVGGVGPYLTLFSRAGISREAADADVAGLEIHELPAVRGCTYVVPKQDFALALKAGQSFGAGEMRLAQKLGVTDKEIGKLCDAVLKALAKGPLDPEEIREATGKASRSLGEEGKKKGLTTTLPLALGKLQSAGEIRRVSMNGRLDQQRFRYALWNPNPLRGFSMSPDEISKELARRYFAWTGPATLAEFQWFSALGVKAAKAAVEPLKLEPIGKNDEGLLLPEHRAEYERFQAPKQAHYVLTSAIDGLSLLRRNLQSIVNEADLKRPFFRAASGGLVPDLPSQAILDRGCVVGLWEYDPETESIAWAAFIPKSKDLLRAIEKAEN